MLRKGDFACRSNLEMVPAPGLDTARIISSSVIRSLPMEELQFLYFHIRTEIYHILDADTDTVLSDVKSVCVMTENIHHTLVVPLTRKSNRTSVNVFNRTEWKFAVQLLLKQKSKSGTDRKRICICSSLPGQDDISLVIKQCQNTIRQMIYFVSYPYHWCINLRQRKDIEEQESPYMLSLAKSRSPYCLVIKVMADDYLITCCFGLRLCNKSESSGSVVRICGFQPQNPFKSGSLSDNPNGKSSSHPGKQAPVLQCGSILLLQYCSWDAILHWLHIPCYKFIG